MTSKTPALYEKPDPSRRRLLTFGAAGVAAVSFADTTFAVTFHSDAVSSDLSRLISSHQQTAVFLESLEVEFYRLLDLPGAKSPPARVDLTSCLNLELKENHWPIWAGDHEEIDKIFDRLGDGGSPIWTEEARARAHAKYADGRRQWEDVQAQLGIPEQRAACLRADAEIQQGLDDLVAFPFASIEDCHAAAKHLAVYMKKYESVDRLDPFHRFVLGLAGVDFAWEEEDA